MSKSGYIFRYMSILKQLRRKPYSTVQELAANTQNRIESIHQTNEDLEIGLSKRTFQRDFKEIKNIFGIDIVYDRSQKGYYIDYDDSENLNFESVLESVDIFTSLKKAQHTSPYILLEPKAPKGTEHLQGLLYAIQNRRVVKFQHQKFWEDFSTNRTVEPLAIKEFKSRWYVLVKDQKDKRFKNFGLDRISNLDITPRSFKRPKDLNVSEKYKNSYGVIAPFEGEPEDVILQFSPFQGKYIKSNPLHNSQKIIKDTEKELRIGLCLYPTHDFIMELLSLGSSVKVLKPKSLVEDIKKRHLQAVEIYKK